MTGLRVDDLDALAREGWRLGGRHCGCNGYHQLWGLLRQAGVVGGTRLDEPVLTPLLRERLADGMRVLVAGAADPAQLGLLARAGDGKRLLVTVADRCAAPLALIARLEPIAGLAIETHQGDLAALDRTEAWDLILSHSMLPFVAPDARRTVLRELRAALRPGGVLVLVVRTAPGVSAAELAGHDAAWLTHARRRLSRVPLPGPAEAVDALLRKHAVDRRARVASSPTREAVEALLGDSDYRLTQVLPGPESTALELDGRRVAARSYVFVAAAA